MSEMFCPYCMAQVHPGESCPSCRLTAGTYLPSPHHLPPGTVLLGRYLVGRALGEGGFGITYIGRDLRLDRKVAIKEYYPIDRVTRNTAVSMTVTSFIGAAAQSYERGKQKFLEEARTMARLEKQHVIVSVRDFFEDNNTAYIVMEYVEGITFRDLVEKKGGRIPPEELLSTLEPLFGALAMMHENDLIHRDISPDNLMLENGMVRLLDFGCAREASRGTETLTIALKHGYAPLEQYQQKGQGPWTDIYALCATIYFCLTGNAPPQALDRIAEDELLVPTKLGIPLTDAQEAALVKGLRIQPRRRFQTVRELWAALYAAEPDATPVTEEDVPLFRTETTAPIAPPAEPAAVPETAWSEHPGPIEEVPASVSPTEENLPAPEKEKVDNHGDRVIRIFMALCIPAILVVFLLIVLLQPNAADPAAPPPAPAISNETIPPPEEPDQPAASDEVDYDSIFSNAAHVFVLTLPDEIVLQAALENDDFHAIVIDAGIDMTISSPMVITKPVLLSDGAHLNILNTVTVDGGLLRIEGNAEGLFTLRTLHGGSISVAADRELWIHFGHIWLENGTEDITVEENGRCFVNGESFDSASTQSVLCFNEDWAMENGIRVTNNAELVTALYNANSNTPAIIIDGNIQYSVDKNPNVPIIVAEGASLEGPSDLSRAWYLEHPILINHGSVWCSFAVYDWDRGPWTVINDGDMRIAASINTDGVFINNGNLELLGGELNEGRYFNRGELFVNDAAEHFNACMDVYASNFCNYGIMHLGRSNNRVLFSGNTRLDNFGEIHVNAGWVEINGVTANRGAFRIHEGGGLANRGVFENLGILTEEVPHAYGHGETGVILYHDADMLQLADPWEDYAARMIPFTGYYSAGDEVHVFTAQELLDALQGDAPVIIAHDGIDMGELGINPRVEGGRILVVSGKLKLGSHSMYIADGSFLLANELDLFYNHLFLEGGSTAVIGHLHGGSVALQEDSRLYVTDYANLSHGFTVSDSSIASFHRDVYFNGVKSDDISNLHFWGANITLANSHLTVRRLDSFSLHVDGNSSLEILEYAYLAWSGHYSIVIDGRLSNHGRMDLPASAHVYGTLDNHNEIHLHNWCDMEVEGRLENYGTIYTYAHIRTVNGGEFTGSEPQPPQE